MKLSAKQKEVVKLMREGSLIIKYAGAGVRMSPESISLKESTFTRLLTIGLIEMSGALRSSTAWSYKLTELGKSIPLTNPE